MAPLQFDREIVYVQKLYYFFFLFSCSALAGLIAGVRFGFRIGLLAAGLGTAIAYVLMVGKKSFPPPAKKAAAQRMAREISQSTSPIALSRFASQLYYYFNEQRRAVSLLEQFLPGHDPLLCATLADILLKQGQPRRALKILRENPHALVDPLLLATQGHALKQLGKTAEAIRMYERSLHFAKEVGFPHNGANWLTQRLLTLSYTAHIHHALAECYKMTDNPTAARRHYWAGNMRLFDVTLWRHPNARLFHSLKSYTNSS